MAGYDSYTRIPMVEAASGLSYTFTLNAGTEVEDAPGVDCDGRQDKGDLSDLSDLRAGQIIAEVDIEHAVVEEVELLRTSCA